MGSEVEILEERLKSFLSQLQAEAGILHRLVYKNKNQHRRCSYFQHLLKVRRDLRLLESAHLEELLGSCFQVISGKKPKQKVHLLESLKKRKCDVGKHNFMERLWGAARLLSQMVEPMLKAATEISILLARSFFMGFSLTILALLARLRVLVQQILLDVVSVFNMVSSLSQKEQSVKIIQEGIEVFREYYPTNEEVVTLECLWEIDKFTLLERMMHKSGIKNRDGDIGGDVPLGSSAVQYQSIKAFLGDDELGSEKADTDHAVKESPSCVKEDTADAGLDHNIESEDGKAETDHSVKESPSCGKEDTADAGSGPSIENEDGKVEGCMNMGDFTGIARSPSKNFSPEGGLLPSSKSYLSPNPLNLKSGSQSKVAFVSVKRPAPSTADATGFHVKKTKDDSGDKEDPFFSLLIGGTLKDSFF